MLVHSLLFVTCFAVPEVAEFEFEVEKDVVYSTVDTRDLLLDAYIPGRGTDRPAVLVVHGGAWRMGNRKQLQGYARALAKKGFVCFAIDYRLAPKHKFPAQIDDCRAAVQWIRRNAAKYSIDVKRLGAIGYSAGGHLVSLLATTGEAPSAENGNVDSRIQAVVAGGTPTDFRKFPDNGEWAEYWMGGDLTDVPDKFRQASPTVFVDKSDPPMFFFNGTVDELVPLAWTTSCFHALQQAGVKTFLHKVEGAGHLQAAANPEALQKAYGFLVQELIEIDTTPAIE